jgi:hypothetical protein
MKKHGLGLKHNRKYRKALRNRSLMAPGAELRALEELDYLRLSV